MIDPLRAAWTGDLEGMVERRIVRILVNYSPTNFSIQRGQPRGFEVEQMKAFVAELSEEVGARPPLEPVFLPVAFDRLLPELLAGRGDIAAAGLTVTPERSAQVAFSAPYIPKVSEVVVSGAGRRSELTDLDALAGREVQVVRGSSYAESLRRLNERFAQQGLDPVVITEMDADLGLHDILEMVHAGLVDLTVGDQHVAELWSSVLDGIDVRSDLAVADGGEIAWAVRPDSVKLKQRLDRFVAENRKGTLMGNIFFKRYYRSTKWITNPLAPENRQRFEQLTSLFQRYGEQYDWDWLMLAAQAYQESGLDQSARSGAGAIGIMQLLPSTAADKSVGIPDISTLENNIHAGAKYMAHLRKTYFPDEDLAPQVAVHFTLAGYNAGPNRIRRLRKVAAERGLDPNRWFFHVEQVVLDEVGREPVQYVANIHKYYVAYRLALEEATAARQRLEKTLGED